MAVDQQESPFVSVFQNHEFDIVGLARMPTDDAARHSSLCKLGEILKYKLAVSTGPSLAKVLMAMTTVALDYADDGHCRYWGKLAVEIRKAAGHGMELATEIEPRIRLGKSYHRALRHFGYRRPDKSPHRFVSTILFHAGIPRPALSQILPVVVEACDEYGSCAENMDRDSRRSLLLNPNLRIQRNVRRLLTSNFTGAEELWRRLVRVVRAWWKDREVALQQLPQPALDVETVQKLLEESPPPKQQVFDF